MDKLQQGCCIFYLIPSSTKGIFLKSAKFHYIDKLVIPSILYGSFGQPTTRDYSEQQEESKSVWAGVIRPTLQHCCNEGILTPVTEIIRKLQRFCTGP